MSCDILVVSYKYVREHLVPRILGGKVAEASLVMPVHRSSPWLADTCHSLRRHQPCLLYVSPFGQNRNYPWKPHPAKQLWLCLSWFSCLWDPWSSDSQAPLLFLFHTNWDKLSREEDDLNARLGFRTTGVWSQQFRLMVLWLWWIIYHLWTSNSSVLRWKWE